MNNKISKITIIITIAIAAAGFILWKVGSSVPSSLQKDEALTQGPSFPIDTQGKGISSKELFEPLRDEPSEEQVQDFVKVMDSYSVITNALEVAQECVFFPAVVKIENGWPFVFKNLDSLEHSIKIELSEPFVLPPHEEKTVEVFTEENTFYRIYCDLSADIAGYVWVLSKGFFSEDTTTPSR